ncbi:MAG: hypothetical protein ACAI38_10120 [Myxococcota bacterium]
MMGMPRNWLIGACVSTFVHIMCARAALRMDPPPPPPPRPMEVELAPPPAPRAREPEPEPEKPARARVTQKTAAKAGHVITAAPDQADASPVDFSIVQGAADRYVGGTTSAVGASDAPVLGPVTPDATATSKRAAVPASPAGSEWDCSALYPADANAPNAAAVMVQVRTDAAGRPQAVSILRDPGHGFGTAARACAMRQTYQPARDADDHEVPGETRPFLVRFHR